jgi:hypothetical protein
MALPRRPGEAETIDLAGHDNVADDQIEAAGGQRVQSRRRIASDPTL